MTELSVLLKCQKNGFGSDIVMLTSHQERVIVAIPSILRILPGVKDDPVLELIAFVPFGISGKNLRLRRCLVTVFL